MSSAYHTLASPRRMPSPASVQGCDRESSSRNPPPHQPPQRIEDAHPNELPEPHPPSRQLDETFVSQPPDPVPSSPSLMTPLFVAPCIRETPKPMRDSFFEVPSNCSFFEEPSAPLNLSRCTYSAKSHPHLAPFLPYHSPDPKDHAPPARYPAHSFDNHKFLERPKA